MNTITRFPRTEAEILALAVVVVQGLREATDDFPAPPVPVDELQQRLERFQTALAAAIAAENGFKEQHAEKDEVLEELVDGLKADLRYAEVAVRATPEKLSKLGWALRRTTPALELPGEVRDIRIAAEGDTWTILGWKQPVDGGAPAFYRIQRKREGSPWEDAGTSTETEHLMSNQPRGVELHYRVIAVNKTGAGQPSGVVTVVL